MSLVNVTSVEVGKNPASVLEGFRFEVIFECLERLEADLEWKLTYVGSSEDKSLDQELDIVVMGPINRGSLKFTFEADGPDFSKIHHEDIHGFTIILLTGSYRDEEFIRIGWYIHNIYVDPELQDDPPDIPILEKMQRIILTEAPRVTRFKISWDNPKIQDMPLISTPVDEEATAFASCHNAMQAAGYSHTPSNDALDRQSNIAPGTENPQGMSATNFSFGNYLCAAGPAPTNDLCGWRTGADDAQNFPPNFVSSPQVDGPKECRNGAPYEIGIGFQGFCGQPTREPYTQCNEMLQPTTVIPFNNFEGSSSEDIEMR